MFKYFLLFFGYCICVALWKKEICQPEQQKINNNLQVLQQYQQLPKRKTINVEIDIDANPPVHNIQQPIQNNHLPRIDINSVQNGDYVGNSTGEWCELSFEDIHPHSGLSWYIKQTLINPSGYVVIRTNHFPAEYTREQVVSSWNKTQGHKPLGILRG